MPPSRSPESDDLGPLSDVIQRVRPQHRGNQGSGHPSSDPVQRLRRWEGIVERAIRDAQESGAFDNLPYQGQRLPPDDDSAAGDLASAFRIMRNAGAAPRWIDADREIRHLLAERQRLTERAARSGPLTRQRYRDDLRRLVDDVNRATLILNYEAPTPTQHRRPLDMEAELAALEAAWTAPRTRRA